MRFLIVKTSSLGDIIQTFPILDFFRENFPNAQIDWVVEKPFAEILQTHPFVANVFTIESKKWRKNLNKNSWYEIQLFRRKIQQNEYDAVFDLQGNVKSGLVTFLAKAKNKVGFGYSTVAEWPNILFSNQRFNPDSRLNIRENYLFVIEQYFNNILQIRYSPKTIHKSENIHKCDNNLPKKKNLLRLTSNENQQLNDLLEQPQVKGKPLFMFCPGSAWENKRISSSVLIEVAKKVELEYGGSFLWVWGTESERKEVEELHRHFKENSFVVPKLPLPMLQHLMDRVDFVFAVDSLSLHLAGTTSTQTLSVFGPSVAIKYAPEGDNHQSLQGECPYKRSFTKRCPILRKCPTGACIKSLDAEKIYTLFPKKMFK